MPSAWKRSLGNIAASVKDSPSAPRLLAGTGDDRVHLLLVCTAERGLCGPFNSAIVRLVRERANALIADGKQIKIFCVGRKGFEQLRRIYGNRIIETVDLRAVRQIKFEHADEIGAKIVALFNAGEFDVCTLFFSRFRSVIAQIPTAQQLIPAVFPENAGKQWRRGLRIRARRGRHPRRASAAQHLGADLPRADGEFRLLLRRADDRDG